MKNINPTITKSWLKLKENFEHLRDFHMKNLFAEDSLRVPQLTFKWKDFYVDISKNIITKDTLDLFCEMAEEIELKSAIESYFSGETINQTEGRAVLHTALRSDIKDGYATENEHILKEIALVKERMSQFSESVISGSKKGFTGKSFTDVVNIGIGGSDLGPQMVVRGLEFYANHLKTHFVSNVDGDYTSDILKNLNPETTLFIVVSKTFTTQETLSNANTIRKWFLESASISDVSKHFVAVSSNIHEVKRFGITDENIFPMWEWVGGRFSLWSAVGLSICLAVGYKNFESLLEGASDMDKHFRTTPFEKNIPVILAFLSVWYNNFFGAESEAVIPYSQYLDRLAPYLQQAIMESNGKSIDRNGNKVNYQTGNIIWGEPGTNAQHAFFQLIHQGTKLIPADFIGFKESLYGNKDHHNKLMSNFFAQTEALLSGKSKQIVGMELKNKGLSRENIEKITPYKVFQGNKPTNTFLIEKLNPKNLGALIAMYEHKIFVQGVIWNIYSYDQWGVELGKQLANTILSDLEAEKMRPHDASTLELINQYKQKKTNDEKNNTTTHSYCTNDKL